MKSYPKREPFKRFDNPERKKQGSFGCMAYLVFLIVSVFLVVKYGPVYTASSNFESDLKIAASRAGARFHDSETVAKEILTLAMRHEIPIERKNIKIQRNSGQIHINVNYTRSVNLLVYQHDLDFKVSASSLVGTL